MEVNVMTRFKSNRIVAIFIVLVAAIILAAVPADAQRAPDVSLRSKVQLNQVEQTKILNASKTLLSQHFGAEMGRSAETRADTNVLQKTAQGYVAETIVLSLLKTTYTAEMSRMEFSEEGGQVKIRKIEKNYRPSFAQNPPAIAANLKLQGEKQKANVFKAGAVPEDIKKFNAAALVRPAEEAEAREVHHSWWAAKGLANTSAPEFPTAVTYTNYIHAVMNSRFGGSAAKRIGAASSKTEIMDFLGKDYNLLAWSNIGHGVTSAPNGSPCYGLVQSGGTMWYYDFTSPAIAPAVGIHWAVALTNSCNSFKDPLNSYIWSRGPRTYIGGNILLPVGRSEQTSYHFWYYTLLARWPMATALAKAQTDLGFPVGTFGLRGYAGVF
jgi:hypothetical protein